VARPGKVRPNILALPKTNLLVFLDGLDKMS
jgi:hypothetical protein